MSSRFRDAEERRSEIKRRRKRTERENEPRYPPPRSEQVLCVRHLYVSGATARQLRHCTPIGVFRRGRKDAISKSALLPTFSVAVAPRSRRYRVVLRIRRRGTTDPRGSDPRVPAFSSALTSNRGSVTNLSFHAAGGSIRRRVSSWDTTTIGRGLSRSAAAVSDRPARAALTRRTLHNSSRAT